MNKTKNDLKLELKQIEKEIFSLEEHLGQKFLTNDFLDISETDRNLYKENLTNRASCATKITRINKYFEESEQNLKIISEKKLELKKLNENHVQNLQDFGKNIFDEKDFLHCTTLQTYFDDIVNEQVILAEKNDKSVLLEKNLEASSFLQKIVVKTKIHANNLSIIENKKKLTAFYGDLAHKIIEGTGIDIREQLSSESQILYENCLHQIHLMEEIEQNIALLTEQEKATQEQLTEFAESKFPKMKIVSLEKEIKSIDTDQNLLSQKVGFEYINQFYDAAGDKIGKQDDILQDSVIQEIIKKRLEKSSIQCQIEILCCEEKVIAAKQKMISFQLKKDKNLEKIDELTASNIKLDSEVENQKVLIQEIEEEKKNLEEKEKNWSKKIEA
ncbi:MAG: hypothetical protein ACRC4W_06930 [Treponemataceae bacterium]